VLSSLDTETENHVFLHLLGDHGLLRSLGATVLLASSSGEFSGSEVGSLLLINDLQ
jgi:hypothetical protein